MGLILAIKLNYLFWDLCACLYSKLSAPNIKGRKKHPFMRILKAPFSCYLALLGVLTLHLLICSHCFGLYVYLSKCSKNQSRSTQTFHFSRSRLMNKISSDSFIAVYTNFGTWAPPLTSAFHFLFISRSPLETCPVSIILILCASMPCSFNKRTISCSSRLPLFLEYLPATGKSYRMAISVASVACTIFRLLFIKCYSVWKFSFA